MVVVPVLDYNYYFWLLTWGECNFTTMIRRPRSHEGAMTTTAPPLLLLLLPPIHRRCHQAILRV